jgi:hypothetical protein
VTDFFENGPGQIITSAIGCFTGTATFVEAAEPAVVYATAIDPLAGAAVLGVTAAAGCVAGIFVDAPGAV